MRDSARLPERHEPVGVMHCKDCGGDVFSVTSLEDETPIECDKCGAVVGRWADVRTLTHIPQKDVLDKTGTDIFGPTYRGVAELSLVGID
jgi:hypothetical protein